MRSFSPCCDLETKQLVWSYFKNQQQVVSSDNEPQVHDSVFFAGCFSDRYADDVKKVTF